MTRTFFVALSFFFAQYVPAEQIANAITVPADVGAINYPDSFSLAIPSTVEVADPYCNLTPSTISFPASYLGSYPLPSPSGAPFAASVQFGVIMKDVWQVGNPTYNSGCAGDVRAAFLQTLQHIKGIGGKFVEVTPWTFIDTSKPAWEIKNPAALNTSTMNDADLEWAINTAHGLNLEVHWRNQIQGAVDSSIPAATVENVTKFMAAYESYMLERAALLQRIKADVMMIGCICWFYPQGETESIFVAKLSELAPKIKAVFSGKLSIWMWTPKIYSDAQLINALDIVELYPLNPNLSSAELQNLNVPTLKTKFAELISGWNQQIDKSKPILWAVGVPSRKDYFTSGYLEETFCTSDANVIAQTGNDCIQRQKQTDFSFQAMVVEAELEAIRDQTYFQTYGVATDGYWLTPIVLPQSTFPNLAVSIRNKPAEALMRQWFNPTGTTTIASTTARSNAIDSNGDGKSDILWRNTNGQVAIWLMNGMAPTSSAVIAAVSTDWTIAGVGDFDGDRKGDILWRNNNGQVAIWLMNGMVQSSGAVIATVGTDWMIAGTGDFDGDGVSDILWRNSSGQVAIWLMNGMTQKSSGVVSTVSNDWTIASTGDFDGDGKSDILWRNIDGRVAIWLMNGMAQKSSSVIATVGNEWKVAGSGDFDGDGKSDILWRNINGEVAIWLMNGMAQQSAGSLGVVGTGWTIAGTGDFNGDGKSDILWRNSNGQAAIWLINGVAQKSGAIISTVGNEWTVARGAGN
jgi:sRNA-binding regulator protein Hfq